MKSDELKGISDYKQTHLHFIYILLECNDDLDKKKLSFSFRCTLIVQTNCNLHVNECVDGWRRHVAFLSCLIHLY